MRFNLGAPILVMILLAGLSGIIVLTRPPEPRADLDVWVFSDNHASMYRQSMTDLDGRVIPSLLDQFRHDTGIDARVDLIGTRAEDIRLVSLFMSQAGPDRVPDLCEIEIGSVGKYFRPPVDQVGLLPLNDLLQKSGQLDRILKSRLAPWSKYDPATGQTVIFGVPNDVHPVALAYRTDLFQQAGVNLESAATWPQFQQLCLQYQRYWAAHGQPNRRAVELYESMPDLLVNMLLQRHINIVDSADRVHLNDPKVAETLAFYAQMRVGPDAVGIDTNTVGVGYTDDLLSGDVGVLWAPDWRAGYLQRFAPDLAGKVRLMPLPRFDPDDAPTSTWGGTMLGIPRNARDPKKSWQLLEFLYLSPASFRARMNSGSGILPPVPDAWSDPIYHQSNPFFGGQKSEELFVDLARQVPDRDVTPFTGEAQLGLAWVLHRAENYVKTNGDAGLLEACQNWLNQAQDELRQRIDFAKL